MAGRQFATFEVADQLFGVEVDTVQEVLSYNEYTPVPLAPPAVGGLFNLRGQVIAAVSVSGPSYRFDEQRIRHALAPLLASTADISSVMVTMRSWSERRQARRADAHATSSRRSTVRRSSRATGCRRTRCRTPVSRS